MTRKLLRQVDEVLSLAHEDAMSGSYDPDSMVYVPKLYKAKKEALYEKLTLLEKKAEYYDDHFDLPPPPSGKHMRRKSDGQKSTSTGDTSKALTRYLISRSRVRK